MLESKTTNSKDRKEKKTKKYELKQMKKEMTKNVTKIAPFAKIKRRRKDHFGWMISTEAWFLP